MHIHYQTIICFTVLYYLHIMTSKLFLAMQTLPPRCTWRQTQVPCVWKVISFELSRTGCKSCFPGCETTLVFRGGVSSCLNSISSFGTENPSRVSKETISQALTYQTDTRIWLLRYHQSRSIWHWNRSNASRRHDTDREAGVFQFNINSSANEVTNKIGGWWHWDCCT
jgi:hypothetical protein